MTRRPLLAALLALLPTSALATPTMLACTNTTSGAQWTIPVDFAHNQVDGRPATITRDQITWRATDTGPNYSFDRKTGILTKISASSTGGIDLFHKCELK